MGIAALYEKSGFEGTHRRCAFSIGEFVDPNRTFRLRGS